MAAVLGDDVDGTLASKRIVSWLALRSWKRSANALALGEVVEHRCNCRR
jgi:hypothetical protein